MGAIKVGKGGVLMVEDEEDIAEIEQRLGRIVSEQRERMQREGPVWWADAVFLFKDLENIAYILDEDEPALADLLRHLTRRSMKKMLLNFHDEQTAQRLFDGVQEESDKLNAIIAKEYGGEQEH